jgi:hypothetical protein
MYAAKALSQRLGAAKSYFFDEMYDGSVQQLVGWVELAKPNIQVPRKRIDCAHTHEQDKIIITYAL